jgi:hypothetical protein
MRMFHRNLPFVLGLAATFSAGLSSASAGQIYLSSLAMGGGSGGANVNVQSFQSLKFITTIKQQYDFSCGSAALATLLTFSYHKPVSESDVFSGMFLNGDRPVIQQYGFSLLDMKNYLSREGLPSGGFRAPLFKLAEIHIPAIGLRSESMADFHEQWSGIFFIILTNIQTAQANFNGPQDWTSEPGAPIDLSRFLVTMATLQHVIYPTFNRF